MGKFCVNCGQEFAEGQKFCGNCGTERQDSGEQSRNTSALSALGISIPPAKVKVSETFNNPDFDIVAVYTVEQENAHGNAINQLLDLSDRHGFEHVREAFNELGEAGSSAAWRIMSAASAQSGDRDAARDLAVRARYCAVTNWDVLLAVLLETKPLAKEVSEGSQNEGWLSQSPHPLSSDIRQSTGMLRRIIEAVYPTSEELQSWLSEDEAGTASILTEAGMLLHNIHRHFDFDGVQPGHAGGMALGLALMSDFGDPNTRARAEQSLTNLVSIQGQLADFANQILEVAALRPKLTAMGLWRWT